MIRFTRYMRPVCLKGQAHASWCTRREIFSHPFWSVRRRNYGTPAASKAGSDAQAQSFKDFLADTQLNIIQVNPGNVLFTLSMLLIQIGSNRKQPAGTGC